VFIRRTEDGDSTFAQQRRIDARRRLVDEPRRVQHGENRPALGVVQRPRLPAPRLPIMGPLVTYQFRAFHHQSTSFRPLLQ
jgi:hypothetical protein